MEHLLTAILPQLPTLKEIVIWGGYIGLFAIVFSETGLLIGFFLPGDSLLVTAGLYASATGELDPAKLIVLLIIAAVCGNATGYLIGLRAGQALYNRPQSRWFRRDHLIKTREFYEKYGGITIVMAQFMPFARTFAPVVAGMILLGYYLGKSIPGIENKIEYVIAIVVFISILPMIIKYIQHRIKQKGDAPRAPGPPSGS